MNYESTQVSEGMYDVDHETMTQIEGVDIERLRSEIEAAERHHQRIAHGLVHLPDGTVQITEEMDLLHGIDQMERTAKRITSMAGGAVKRIKSPFSQDGYDYVLSPLGDAIWTMCRTTIPMIAQIYPGCRKPARWSRGRNVPEGMRPVFNPRITVLLHACQVALPTLISCTGLYPDLSLRAIRRALEHVLRSVRRIFSSRRFKYQENNYQRNAKERYREARKYIAALFVENSRLLFLRVDIYFMPDYKE